MEIASEIFGVAECEIIHFVNCEISPFGRCEMKFAHIRVSEYFTFASANISQRSYFTCPKGKFRWKKLVRKNELFSGRGSWIRTNDEGVKVPCLATWRYPCIKFWEWIQFDVPSKAGYCYADFSLQKRSARCYGEEYLRVTQDTDDVGMRTNDEGVKVPCLAAWRYPCIKFCSRRLVALSKNVKFNAQQTNRRIIPYFKMRVKS